MRGTETDTEVERRGGEQARKCEAGSLNPSKISRVEGRSLNRPPPCFFYSFQSPIHSMQMVKGTLIERYSLVV